jgi:hypothetical protein
MVPTLLREQMIREHMEVLGSDGAHVGTVDRMQGADKIRLSCDGPPDGADHLIPLDWVVHAEIKVHLRQTGAEAKAQWGSC